MNPGVVDAVSTVAPLAPPVTEAVAPVLLRAAAAADRERRRGQHADIWRPRLMLAVEEAPGRSHCPWGRVSQRRSSSPSLALLKLRL